MSSIRTAARHCHSPIPHACATPGLHPESLSICVISPNLQSAICNLQFSYDRSHVRDPPASPRDTVHARLPDGRIFEAPPATPIGDILRVAEAHAGVDGHEAVAAVVDGRLRELTMPLVSDADVAAVTLNDTDGSRIYRRSLTLVLVTAAAELFPDAAVFVEHSAPTLGAYYCRVRGRAPFSAGELEAIAARMRAIVAADVPIHKTKVPLAQAVAIFEARGETDKARLLAHRQQDSLVLYELCGRQDYFQGYMLPSTGRLRQFALHPLGAGFVLQYPHTAKPGELARFEAYPKLFEAFAQAGAWLDTLGIRGTGALNDAITQGRLPEVSLVGEALHEAHISRIADRHRRARRRHARGARRRPVVVGQDHVFQAPGRAAAGRAAAGRIPWRSTTTSWTATARRLTSTANATSSRSRRSTCPSSTSTCSR